MTRALEAARIRPRLLTGILGVAASVALQGSLLGQDRLFRRYAAGQGLQAAPVSALGQDAAGFLWIGGQDGLFRYDGTEFRRWAAGDLEGLVRAIAADGGDRLVAMTEAGLLYEVVGESARPLAPPLPSGPGEPNALAFDGRGRLWVVRGGRVAYVDPGEGWRMLPPGAFAGEEPRLLRATPSGEMAVGTRRGVWRADPGSAAVKLVEAYEPVDVVFREDGEVAVLDNLIREVREGRERHHDPFAGFEFRPRPIALAMRGGTLWAAYDRYLVAVRPNLPPEVLGTDNGIESGGPLLVDREGSLWMGTFTALLQYPEPETRIWNERSGLLSQHTRFVGRSGDALWVTTWQGVGLLRRRGTRGPAVRWVDDFFSQQEVCADRSGSVWLAGVGEILQIRGEQVVGRRSVQVTPSLRCGPDRAGGTWLAVGDRLFHADPSGLRPAVAPPLPAGARPVRALLHDGRSPPRLWVGGDGMICRGDLAETETIAGWECTELPQAGLILAFVEMPGGTIWAAASRAGVLREEEGRWREVAGNEMLPSRSLLNLIPSPAGGIWILGHSVVWRVREPDDVGAPWEVLERLGEWHGLPAETGRDLHEDPDGTLWITTSLGLIEVPKRAREAPQHPPAVALVQALVDEEPVGTRGDIELPYRRHLELRFAVLSYRDPARLRHQVRLGAGDAWREATGRPWFRWIDLPARSHRAELRASLDGTRWTAVPAALAFRVRPPWYRTSWSIALFTLAGSLALWLGYRARVRYLLGLERERTRIAMDLHDEMGSGLGSIGILSGLLSSRGLEDAKGRELAGRIARTAEDLGGSLSNIIWSLDARPATLRELASRLADAGMNLLAAQEIEFRTTFPETWPPDRLSARERQNLLLIGLEALHNAARHSRAGRVTLEISRAGRRWKMAIVDDGVGFDRPAAENGGGHGLGTTRRRAEEIGAWIEWDTRPGHGTAVVLRFSLATPRARPPVTGSGSA